MKNKYSESSEHAIVKEKVSDTAGINALGYFSYDNMYQPNTKRLPNTHTQASQLIISECQLGFFSIRKKKLKTNFKL